MCQFTILPQHYIDFEYSMLPKKIFQELSLPLFLTQSYIRYIFLRDFHSAFFQIFALSQEHENKISFM